MADWGAGGAAVLLHPLRLLEWPAPVVARHRDDLAVVAVGGGLRTRFLVERGLVDARLIVGADSVGGQGADLRLRARRQLRDLDATGRHLFVERVAWGVALDQRVVIAEDAVPRDAQPGRLERLVHVLEQPGEVAHRVRALALTLVLRLVR